MPQRKRKDLCDQMNAQTHRQLADFCWGKCNLLRGPYNRNQYRKVILPLTVLRRFEGVDAGGSAGGVG